MKKHVKAIFYLAMLILVTAMGLGCAGKQAVPMETASPAKAESSDLELDKKYTRIVFQEFEVPDQINNDYPEAATTCKVAAISKLKQKKMFDEVEEASTKKTYDSDTLLVKVKVEEMRVVSGAARFWGGALVGSSSITLNAQFVNAKTGEVVGHKKLSSANNPFGAAWTAGSSDKSLPADMGVILAEYIALIMPNDFEPSSKVQEAARQSIDIDLPAAVEKTKKQALPEKTETPALTAQLPETPEADVAADQQRPETILIDPKKPAAVTALEQAKIEPDIAPVLEKKKHPAQPFFLHIASFRAPQNAQNELKRLRSLGFEAYIETVDLGTKGVWHRANVGHYSTRDEARQALNNYKLKNPGANPLILKNR